jgi:hypothetical protein
MTPILFAVPMFTVTLTEVIGIVLSLVASVLIGGFWYSPFFAGPMWMREIGLTEEKINNAKLTPMGVMTIAILLDLLFAVLVNLLFTWIGVRTVGQGAVFAAACSAVFYVVPLLVHGVFDGSSKKVWAVYATHELLHSAVVGAIVAWSILA